jgi:hypothetical protein
VLAQAIKATVNPAIAVIFRNFIVFPLTEFIVEGLIALKSSGKPVW